MLLISNNVSMGTKTASGNQFAAFLQAPDDPNAYIFQTMLNLGKKEYVLTGRYSGDAMMASFKGKPKFLRNLNFDFSLQIPHIKTEQASTAMSAAFDYRGSGWTGGFKALFPHNVLIGSFVTTMGSPDFTVGAEMTHVLDNRTSLSYMGRQKLNGGGILSAMLVPNEFLAVMISRKVSPMVTLASQLEYAIGNNDSRTTIGMIYQHPNVHTRFKTNVDLYNMKIQSSLETPIGGPLRMTLTAEVDHASGNTTAGIGFSVN